MMGEKRGGREHKKLPSIEIKNVKNYVDVDGDPFVQSEIQGK